jgi:hypothetical protein
MPVTIGPPVSTNPAFSSNQLEPNITTIVKDISSKTPKKMSSPDTIYLDNPSFEGTSSAGVVPPNWFNYGHSGETPPDTQPGCFNVETEPQDGETYLGMVTRDNGTTEGVIQRLDYPLLPGNKYEMSFFLATSMLYTSMSKKTNEVVKYTTPVNLKIMGYKVGSNSLCKFKELKNIYHDDWELYTIQIEPCDTIECIVFAVVYPHIEPVNGNILIDNCSPIMRVQSLKSKASTDK